MKYIVLIQAHEILKFKLIAMLKAEVTIKRASKIPLLGVTTQPSPYLIIQCEQLQYTSPIAKFTQNPQWQHQITVTAVNPTSYLHIYIYNNNTNAVDQLLAYGKMEFGQLLTRKNSEYKLRLVNSLQQKINSYLYLQHYDANPQDLYLPMGERTCIKLRMITCLPQGLELLCQYGDNQFGLSKELEEHAFKYNPKVDKINCILRKWINRQLIEMHNTILIGNIGQNNCFSLKFYDLSEEYIIFMSASVVINGFIPNNYNILHTKLIDITKSNGKKSGNCKLKIFGPLNQSGFDYKQQTDIYVQNSSEVVIEYFQDNDLIDDLQPYCRFLIPVNSLNWSNDSYESTFTGKYFENFKNIETTITLQFSLKKNSQLSKIIPKIKPPENLFDQDSPLLIDQLKLNNCFLFEVIKNSQVQLIHVNTKGIVTAFYKFLIKEDKTEYIIDTKSIISKGGKGALYLINLDQSFTEIQSNKFENSIIFKINLNKPNNFQNEKVEYDFKFLAFAKKVSLVNICKRFNQMVHDDLLKLKVKTKYTGQIKRGLLKIINLKCEGTFGDIECAVQIDGSNFKIRSQIGNYMINKSYFLNVGQGNVGIKVKMYNVSGLNEPNSKQNEKNYKNCSYYGRFCDFFGSPQNNNIYSLELKLSPSHKFQIIYSFQEQLAKVLQPQQTDLMFFSPNTALHLKLKQAFTCVNNQIYTFKIARGQFIFQTLPHLTSNNKIYFDKSEEMTLPFQNQQQANLIFINAYSHDEQNKFVIYNGFVNIKHLVGKGQYQVLLIYQKEGKRKQISLIIQVLHSVSFESSGALLKFNKIGLNSNIPLFKSVYKHYLLVNINFYQYDIFECTLNQNNLILNGSINIIKGDNLDLYLYSSIKVISKQIFAESEKQLIGYGKLPWEYIQKSGILVIDYYPKKQSQIKLTKNVLSIQQQSYKLLLSYVYEPINKEARIQPLNLKANITDIDVLNSGIVKLNIKEYIPIFISAKIAQIQLKSINLVIISQSNMKMNKSYYLKAHNMQFELQAIVTLKQEDKYRRSVQKALVNLRGNHNKINQLTSIKIVFQGLMILSGNITIFNNKFTNIPTGEIVVKQISLRGNKINKFDLSFMKNTAVGDPDEVQFKKQGMQYKNNPFSLKTFDELNGVCINIEGKDVKQRQILCFSQFNIDRYDQQFTYEKRVLIFGQSLIISIKLQYSCLNPAKIEENIIRYQLQDSSKRQDIEVKYFNEQYNRLKTINTINKDLKRAKGFMITISVPQIIAEKTKKIQIFMDNSEPVSLMPSLINNQQYIYYTSKQIKIKNIKLFNSQLIDKSMEYLGSINGLQKFMVDQNPKLICSLKSTPCLITNIDKQNWIIRVKFHRVFARENKRLLRLKNTANDEILTKQLGVMIKHGTQMHFIFGLNEFGSQQENKVCQFELGYDNNCDILQFYLFVDNYFNRKAVQNHAKMFQNWIQFFPVSYGIINLSNFAQDGCFGCELKGILNSSINLEKSLNELIVRENGIYCLGNLSFEKKAWGYINLTLLNQTAISFTNKKQKKTQNLYIYYKVEIQNSNRNISASLTTQARPVIKTQNIAFTSNELTFFFVQQNQQQYNLKITGFLIDSSQHYAFVQKRQDLSDYLPKRGKQSINVQIKTSDTNNLCQNTYQLTFELNNSIKPPQPQNLIQKAKSINTVDALSFQQFSNTQFFERLLGCQNPSHFYECLQQIKESFIYSQDPQLETFIYLAEYLAFDWDLSVIDSICEIIHLNLLKAPQIITDLQERQITKFIYNRFKTICKGEAKQIPDKITKITTLEFIQTINKFKQHKNIQILKSAIIQQSFILFPPEQLILRPSSKNNQIILNILMLLLKNSKQIKNSLQIDLPQWMQICGFSPNKNEFELFILLVKLLTANNLPMQQKNLIRLIDILIEKKYILSMVFEFWQRVDKNEKIHIYLTILEKYSQQFQTFFAQTCRGIHMMLSQIYDFKNIEQCQKLLSSHQPTIKLLSSNISKSNDIALISSHLDLLVYLFELKMINQAQKMQIEKLIKQKTGNFKDTSSKLILANYNSKISKNRDFKNINGKKQSKPDENNSKNRFNKKYLITTD